MDVSFSKKAKYLFFFFKVTPDGNLVVTRLNPHIQPQVIVDLHILRSAHHLSLEDALTNVRSRMVPNGYTPCPFRKNTPESKLH